MGMIELRYDLPGAAMPGLNARNWSTMGATSRERGQAYLERNWSV